MIKNLRNTLVYFLRFFYYFTCGECRMISVLARASALIRGSLLRFFYYFTCGECRMISVLASASALICGSLLRLFYYFTCGECRMISVLASASALICGSLLAYRRCIYAFARFFYCLTFAIRFLPVEWFT